MELMLYFVGTMIMLLVTCIIGSLVLVKDAKEFHIQLSWKGFEVSGSFFHKKKKN